MHFKFPTHAPFYSDSLHRVFENAMFDECNDFFFYSRSSSSQFLSFSLSLIVNNSSPAVSTLSFLCLSFLCLSIQNASFSFKMLPVLCTMPTSVDTIPSYCTNCRDNNRNALDYSGWYCHCKLY